MTISQRFVRLALALDRHIPGYIDAYFGPPEWKEQSIAHGPRRSLSWREKQRN